MILFNPEVNGFYDITMIKTHQISDCLITAAIFFTAR